MIDKGIRAGSVTEGAQGIIAVAGYARYIYGLDEGVVAVEPAGRHLPVERIDMLWGVTGDVRGEAPCRIALVKVMLEGDIQHARLTVGEGEAPSRDDIEGTQRERQAEGADNMHHGVHGVDPCSEDLQGADAGVAVGPALHVVIGVAVRHGVKEAALADIGVLPDLQCRKDIEVVIDAYDTVYETSGLSALGVSDLLSVVERSPVGEVLREAHLAGSVWLVAVEACREGGVLRPGVVGGPGHARSGAAP